MCGFVWSLALVRVALAPLLLLGSVISGSGEERAAEAPPSVSRPAEIPVTTPPVPLAPSQSLSPAEARREYRVGPDDLLEITVFGVEELTKTVRVSAEGTIRLPLIGRVPAAGLSVEKLEKEIAGLLREKYLHDPEVTVFVKEYRSQRVSVVGAVRSPQVYETPGPKRLLDLLTQAGGVTPDAGQKCFIIRTVVGPGGQARSQTTVVDLDLLFGGDLSLNVPILAGDLIHVPKAGIVYVDGAVNAPGLYPLQPKTTLTQVIVTAKGPLFEADLTEVRILREKPGKEREEIKADFKAIKAKEEPDIPIQNNDIVIVPSHGGKAFLAGFWQFARGVLTFGAVPLW